MFAHLAAVVPVTLALATLGAPTIAAARCAPAVRVDGDDRLAREVALDLIIRGIDRSAAPDCPLVRVQVAAGGDSIRVVITDPYGTSERVVGEVATASALAASWAEELVAPAAIRPIAAPPGAVAPADPPPAAPGNISVLYELAFDANQLRWQGVALAGCAAVGPVCVGGVGRIGIAARYGEYPPMLVPIASEGTAYDALASVAYPIRLGKFVVAPELDLGIGHVHYEWQLDARAGPDRSDALSVRAGARVSASRSIGGGFSIAAAIAVDALPARYTRYDDPLPPIRVFELNPSVRLALGVRH